MAALLVIAIGLGGCGSGAGVDVDAFCEQLGVATGPEGALGSLAADPDAAEAVFDEFESLRRLAPLEMEPPLEVIIETSRSMITAFAESDGSAYETLQRLRPEIADLTEASETLTRYAVEQCGLELRSVPVLTPTYTDQIQGDVNLDVEG